MGRPSGPPRLQCTHARTVTLPQSVPTFGTKTLHACEIQKLIVTRPRHLRLVLIASNSIIRWDFRTSKQLKLFLWKESKKISFLFKKKKCIPVSKFPPPPTVIVRRNSLSCKFSQYKEIGSCPAFILEEFSLLSDGERKILPEI